MTSAATPEGRHWVTDLTLPVAEVEVWVADDARHVPGWKLAEVNVVLNSGRPFGSVTFRRDEGNRVEQVAVRWNHVQEQLHCFVVRRGASDAEKKGLELDTRSRVGTLMAAYAEVGAAAATRPPAAAAIRAAAHLVPEPSQQSQPPNPAWNSPTPST